jgi:putative membrane protein
VWDSQWGGHMMGGWWGMGLYMGGFLPLLIGICVAVIVAMVRGRNLDPGDDFRGTPALRILEERYARGEISKQEYEDKKRDLRS